MTDGLNEEMLSMLKEINGSLGRDWDGTSLKTRLESIIKKEPKEIKCTE